MVYGIWFTSYFLPVSREFETPVFGISGMSFLGKKGYVYMYICKNYKCNLTTNCFWVCVSRHLFAVHSHIKEV